MKEVPIWFPGARLNYAENLLYRNDDAIAITAGGESGVVTNYTFRQLRHLVRRMAAALGVNGLQPGDRVAGWFLYDFLSGFWMLMFSVGCPSNCDQLDKCRRYCTRYHLHRRDILEYCHRHGNRGWNIIISYANKSLSPSSGNP